MKSQIIALFLTITASTSWAIAASLANSTTRSTECEGSIKLFAISDELGRTGITNYHEGAGINYLFLTGIDSPTYIYNQCTRKIYVPFASDYKQYLNVDGSLVQLTVSGPNGEFGVVKNGDTSYLTLDGDSQGWVACKNTSDPYNYSRNLYQLAYGNNTLTGCKNILVEVERQ